MLFRILTYCLGIFSVGNIEVFYELLFEAEVLILKLNFIVLVLLGSQFSLSL